MRLPTVLELARGTATFQRYQDGALWYAIPWEEFRQGVFEGEERACCETRLFEFPIQVSDAGGGEFLPQDKALTFMRWIRRHLEYLHGALAEGVYDQ